MGAMEHGWHVADVGAAVPGSRYGFSLDGGPIRPDPRSHSQPDGVHGLSEVVDQNAYVWTDEAWRGTTLSDSVIYELHVGTFSPDSTFEGAAGKLQHLVDLGVDVVELMPVAEFPGARGWGYDGASLFAPHHSYGGPDGLKRLVDACHAAGLGVVLDVVYNHLGPAGNYLNEFGPYFTDRYSTPWGMAVNFDGPESDAVREFVVANASMWFRDYHFDGLRIDAVHAIFDMSATHILEELALRVDELRAELRRDLFLIAESDLNDPRVVQRREQGGYGIDAQWSDDFHHALHCVLTGERDGYYADFGSIAQLAKALREGYVYDGCYSRARRRRHGRPAEGVPGSRFVGYLQNHDQIGNRAHGDRTSHLLDVDRLKIGAALALTAPFVPMLFQGEEWAASAPFLYFTDHDDEALARAVTEGRAREFESFGWSPDQVPDPQAVSTFEASRLDWGELSRGIHLQVFDWHRRLLAMRKQHSALRDGCLDEVEVTFDEAARWLIMRRGPVAVACNFAGVPATLAAGAAKFHTVLASCAPAPNVQAGYLELPGTCVVVLIEEK